MARKPTEKEIEDFAKGFVEAHQEAVGAAITSALSSAYRRNGGDGLAWGDDLPQALVDAQAPFRALGADGRGDPMQVLRYTLDKEGGEDAAAFRSLERVLKEQCRQSRLGGLLSSDARERVVDAMATASSIAESLTAPLPKDFFLDKIGHGDVPGLKGLEGKLSASASRNGGIVPPGEGKKIMDAYASFLGKGLEDDRKGLSAVLGAVRKVVSMEAGKDEKEVPMEKDAKRETKGEVIDAARQFDDRRADNERKRETTLTDDGHFFQDAVMSDEDKAVWRDPSDDRERGGGFDGTEENSGGPAFGSDAEAAAYDLPEPEIEVDIEAAFADSDAHDLDLAAEENDEKANERHKALARKAAEAGVESPAFDIAKDHPEASKYLVNEIALRLSGLDKDIERMKAELKEKEAKEEEVTKPLRRVFSRFDRSDRSGGALGRVAEAMERFLGNFGTMTRKGVETVMGLGGRQDHAPSKVSEKIRGVSAKPKPEHDSEVDGLRARIAAAEAKAKSLRQDGLKAVASGKGQKAARGGQENRPDAQRRRKPDIAPKRQESPKKSISW